MKNKHFKKGVEDILIYVTLILFIVCASINDFEDKHFPIVISMWLVVAINIYVLHKYGNKRLFEEGEENAKN